MTPPSASATLLVTCPDQRGLVRRLSDFIYRYGGNLLQADQQVDEESGQFLARFEWDLEGFSIPSEEIDAAFAPIADELGMRWELRFSQKPLRTAIFVSRFQHCLLDLLHRYSIGELHCELVAVISNHPDLEPFVSRVGIPYHVFPVTAATKAEQEARELALLDSLNVDLIVLARYMQVLSPEFVERYPNQIINIHHSFLPAFSGGRPYEQAYDRGVKLIGATSHYVTPVLDDGPIIEQDIVRVSHRDTLDDYTRKGRDIERLVLARGVRAHLEGRVLPCGNRTVVFE
jgi:formyltetrahydrofolate deformylase